jgi:hypothetical protein
MVSRNAQTIDRNDHKSGTSFGTGGVGLLSSLFRRNIRQP